MSDSSGIPGRAAPGYSAIRNGDKRCPNSEVDVHGVCPVGLRCRFPRVEHNDEPCERQRPH